MVVFLSGWVCNKICCKNQGCEILSLGAYNTILHSEKNNNTNETDIKILKKNNNMIWYDNL